MIETIEIPNAESMDLAYGYTFEEDEETPYAGWKFIQDIDVDQSRWGIISETVVQDPEGRYWSLKWERGATENQDYTDFSNGEAKTWTRVYPQQVMTTQYVTEPDASAAD